MNRLTLQLTAISFGVAFALPAIAQQTTTTTKSESVTTGATTTVAPATPSTGRTLGTVVEGNSTVEFKAADTRAVDVEKLRTWGDFKAAHPEIAREMAYKPALISDPAYAGKHPELASFFSAHPDIREAMIENPGNYVAIPPRPGE
jgi:hypothetical protein